MRPEVLGLSPIATQGQGLLPWKCKETLEGRDAQLGVACLHRERSPGDLQ